MSNKNDRSPPPSPTPAVLSMSQREIAGLSFQKRVLDWLMECFSNEICRDGVGRNHRFLEESLELVQSLGCTRSEAHQLVDYVFGRPVGEPMQELGGVMVTLSALASCHDMDLNEAGETELARVWSNIEKIRAKQLAKPKHSPLPSLPPTLNSGAAQLTKQFIIDVIRCHVWFKENWDQTQELTGLDRAADDILEEVPRAVDGGASTSRPFYGAECPSYPACNGGCGLGCTKEIEQARAVEGAAVREALEPFAKLAERSRTWERANHGDTRVVLTSPALQGGSATLSTKDFQRAESALSHHNSGDGK